MKKYINSNVSLDYKRQGMAIEVNEDTYDLSWFHVDGHDCPDDELVTAYPIELVEGKDCQKLWQDNGGTGLVYATWTKIQAEAIVSKLQSLGATDGIQQAV